MTWNVKNFAEALMLEIMFSIWCGEHYEMFWHPKSEFPGIGTTREVFIHRMKKLIK
jgi:hypothetical protein